MKALRQFWAKFMSIYKQHPCLWDKTLDYDNTLKDAAYESLVSYAKLVYPNADKQFVIRKLKIWRRGVRKELKKVKCEVNYKPTKWYYNRLLFSVDNEEANQMFCVQNRQLWVEFINIYKQHPCLWDITSNDYNNKTLKDAAYENLVSCAKILHPKADKQFVRSKLKIWKRVVRKELKKVKCEVNYKPTKWYYNMLLFSVDNEEALKVGVKEDGNGEELCLLNDCSVKRETEEELVILNEHSVKRETEEKLVILNEHSVKRETEEKLVTLNEHSVKREVEEEVVILNEHGVKRETHSLKENFTTGATDEPIPPSSLGPGHLAEHSELELKRLPKRKRHEETSQPLSSMTNFTSTQSDKNRGKGFLITGKKIGSDIRDIHPEQRIFVEKIISDAIYYGRLKKLNKNSHIQLNCRCQGENFLQ